MNMIETMKQLALADRADGRDPRTPAELAALFGHLPMPGAPVADEVGGALVHGVLSYMPTVRVEAPAESSGPGIAFAAGFASTSLRMRRASVPSPNTSECAQASIWLLDMPTIVNGSEPPTSSGCVR